MGQLVRVNLWSGLRRFAGGETVVAVEASTVREMFNALMAAHPGLEPFIRAGLSVSINGVIEPNIAAPVYPDSEIYLIQQLKGG